MYNYLSKSTSGSGTINDTNTTNGETTNYGYWTMSAYTQTGLNFAWIIDSSSGGHLGTDAVYRTISDARAVVVVSK